MYGQKNYTVMKFMVSAETVHSYFG